MLGNREIKFRAWDKKKKQIIDHNRLFRIDCSNEYPFLALLENMYDYDLDVQIMQYTGLKDRNGKEIYEGDIIKITYDTVFAEKPFYIGVIKYGANEGYPAFDLDPWIDCEMNALSWLKSESDPSVLSYEVIGNIYEHPNLLKEANQNVQATQTKD